jgi:hypothetical protein
MKTFGKQTYRLLDKLKPYQRRKLSHRRLATRTATAELPAPTAVGSGDFHEKAVKWNICCTWFFYSEWAALARRERITLPSELTV